MSYLISYVENWNEIHDKSEQILGSAAMRRWDEISRLLPAFLRYINEAINEDWGRGVACGVVLFADGSTSPHLPPPVLTPPTRDPFDLDSMLCQEWMCLSEVYVSNVPEWDRLFRWCDFLAQRDGAYEFYAPLAGTLRRYLGKILQSVDQAAEE